MELLQREIDVEPGVDLTALPATTPGRGRGGAALRIKNNTAQVVEYKVFVKSGRDSDPRNPYWQESWYYFRANELPPNTPSVSPKPDRFGAEQRDVRVSINSKGERIVYLLFNIPRTPQSRAGRYPLEVYVEASVKDSTDTPTTQRFALDLNIQPFYDWEIRAANEPKATFWKRKGEAMLAVVNRSNDWLYADIVMPPPKDFAIETRTFRVAVRPPETGEEEAVRHVPLPFVAKITPFRGDDKTVPLGVTADRVDAPSVPRLPKPNALRAPETGAVLSVETPDKKPLPQDRASIKYQPAIAATLTGCLAGLVQNAFLIGGTVIALGVLLWGGMIAAATLWKLDVVPSSSIVAKPLTDGKYKGFFAIPVKGKDNQTEDRNIALTELWIKSSQTGKWEEVKAFDYGDTTRKRAENAPPIFFPKLTRKTIYLPASDYDHQSVEIGYKWRVGWLPPIDFGKEPRAARGSAVQLGAPQTVIQTGIVYSGVVGKPGVFPGEKYTIIVTPATLKKENIQSVTVMDKELPFTLANGKLVVTIPSTMEADSGSVLIALKSPDTFPAPLAITVKAVATPAPIPTVPPVVDGTTGGGQSGGGASGGGAGGSGGTATGGTVTRGTDTGGNTGGKQVVETPYDMLANGKLDDVVSLAETDALTLSARAFALSLKAQGEPALAPQFDAALAAAQKATLKLRNLPDPDSDQLRAIGLYHLANYNNYASDGCRKALGAAKCDADASAALAEASKISEVEAVRTKYGIQ